MPANSPTNSTVPSQVPPEIQAFFGDPPLMRGEDVSLYNKLMNLFTELVDPKDAVEWWWVKDVTDHTWEIRRLRRFKVLFVELKRDQVTKNRAVYATLRTSEDEDDEAEYVPVPVPDSEKDSAEFFMYRLDECGSVDKLIASAELRRDRALREIERRRERLARLLRKASDEIIHAGELLQAAE